MKMPRPKTLLLISACTAVLTIILKMGAWYVTGSVGLLSDGLESFVNLAGAVFALLMVTIAERPADADHPHGHHKAEYFSSGFEGVLIFAAALGILWTAIDRLFHPQPLEQVGWGLCSLPQAPPRQQATTPTNGPSVTAALPLPPQPPCSTPTTHRAPTT